jgi:hypothetical protein
VAYKEKDTTLAGDIPTELVKKFDESIPEHLVKRHVLAAAVKLWVELPPEVRTKLLSQELDANSLVSLVQEIVDETIADGRQAAKRVQKVIRKQKRPSRGGS